MLFTQLRHAQEAEKVVCPPISLGKPSAKKNPDWPDPGRVLDLGCSSVQNLSMAGLGGMRPGGFNGADHTHFFFFKRKGLRATHARTIDFLRMQL